MAVAQGLLLKTLGDFGNGSHLLPSCAGLGACSCHQNFVEAGLCCGWARAHHIHCGMYVVANVVLLVHLPAL